MRTNSQYFIVSGLPLNNYDGVLHILLDLLAQKLLIELIKIMLQILDLLHIRQAINSIEHLLIV